jgi:hypothetical protein
MQEARQRSIPSASSPRNPPFGCVWGKRLGSLQRLVVRALPLWLTPSCASPDQTGWPDFLRLLKAAFSSRGDEFAIYAFDLLQLKPSGSQTLTADREPQRLEGLVGANVPGLHLVDAFADQRHSEAAEPMA